MLKKKWRVIGIKCTKQSLKSVMPRPAEKSARLFDAQLTVHKFGYARAKCRVVRGIEGVWVEGWGGGGCKEGHTEGGGRVAEEEEEEDAAREESEGGRVLCGRESEGCSRFGRDWGLGGHENTCDGGAKNWQRPGATGC